MGLFDQHNAKTCLSICTPLAMITGPRGDLIYKPISPLWHRARNGLHFPTNFNTAELSADGMEVGDARSKVAAQVRTQKPPSAFLFFLDSDVIVPHDALTKLFFRARCFPDHDIFCGVYCLKNDSVPDPLIYADLGQGPYWDWTVGDLLTTREHGIKYVHMGLTLIRVSLFQKLIDAGLIGGDGTDQNDRPFFQSNNIRDDSPGKVRLKVGSEDIFFCDLAAKINTQVMVDTSVLAGHVNEDTGVVYGLPHNYGPGLRAKWMPRPGKDSADVAEAKQANKKLALDVGAGGERREWPDHITYTTDIRADSKPDYVQDSRLLNLPPDRFDLLASSHHLEHIPRFDQEIVWRSMFKITKPGGACEHIVPSVEWAARKIVEGDVDGHVVNVLYGAQESHGYERIFNLHYFGYTKALAKALAEQAGYVDVTCEDWRDNEDLGYNLIIRAKKPLPSQPSDDVAAPLNVAEELGTDAIEEALRPV